MDKNIKNSKFPEVKTDFKKIVQKSSSEPKNESRKLDKGSVTSLIKETKNQRASKKN